MISSIKISPGKQHLLTAILHSFALHFAIMKNIFGAKNLHNIGTGRFLHILDRFYSMYRMTVKPLMSKNI